MIPSSNRAACSLVFSGALLVCLLAAGLHTPVAVAAEATARPAATSIRFATVSRISGEVTATAGEGGQPRTLRQNDAVFVGERIQSNGTAEALLKTDDAGLIAIRPRAEFVAEQFAADGTAADHFTLRLIKGGLRMITGWIGRTNRAQYRVTTLTATIGVRGTDHEPYVIADDLGDKLLQPEGTYDKVNRGGTTMDVNGKTLDIDPGKVGFARSARAPKPDIRTRGLMTVALPVLLDKIPEFYVPGQFDEELDRLSQTADANALRELNARRKGVKPAPDTPAAPAPKVKPAAKPAPVGAAVSPAPGPAAAADGSCVPDAIARTWLAEFDAAIARRDAPAIVQKFAPEVVVRVTARGANGAPTTIEMGRDELARSTLDAVSGLTNYQQRRPSITGQLAEGGGGACDRISVRSVVIEQGRQNGKPYRFESVEEFVLVQRAGQWLAIRADATQR